MPINKSMLFGSGRSNSGWFRVVPPVRVLLAATLIQGALIQGTMVGAAHAQDASSRADLAPDEVNNAAKQAADRFFDVLKRRPRRGIALDRVYGYHVQNRSLDSFLESLENDSSGNDAQRGTRMFILGLMQTQRGKAAAAENALSVAEELLPDEAMVCFERGRALLAIGETERAADAFERAIDRGPARNEALPIYTELGQLYARVGDREKSLRVWKRLEQQIPGDQRIQTQIAATLAREGQYDEALRRYTELAKTARKEDDQIAAAIGAAEMRRKLDQPDQAVADLEAILARLRPGSWLYRDVRNRIEDGFIRGGDYDGLAKYYQAKLDAAPDDLSLRTRLGGILMRAGRLQDAIGMLREAVERAPDDADVRLSLIEVLEKTGDREAAAKQYEALTQRDAGNPDYLLRWGELVASDPKVDPEQRAERAVAIWKRLADARNDDAVVLSQIADRYRSVKRDEDAIELYRRAIEIDPTSPQYREYLGEYLLQLDRKPEAIEVWKSIAAGDRRDRDALVRLAEVFTTFKLRDEAIAAWDDAASTDLDFGQRLRYASVLSDNESYERALETLEEAAELAETPEDREQLLTQRIKTYKDSGTLDQRIAQVAKDATSAGDFRELAMMHSAGGQMTDAATAIDR
ncbi:MAG: tetratricopeptide repeat protein, partial [Planctomycetota bacterium]